MGCGKLQKGRRSTSLELHLECLSRRVPEDTDGMAVCSTRLTNRPCHLPELHPLSWANANWDLGTPIVLYATTTGLSMECTGNNKHLQKVHRYKNKSNLLDLVFNALKDFVLLLC